MKHDRGHSICMGAAPLLNLAKNYRVLLRTGNCEWREITFVQKKNRLWLTWFRYHRGTTLNYRQGIKVKYAHNTIASRDWSGFQLPTHSQCMYVDCRSSSCRQDFAHLDRIITLFTWYYGNIIDYGNWLLVLLLAEKRSPRDCEKTNGHYYYREREINSKSDAHGAVGTTRHIVELFRNGNFYWSTVLTAHTTSGI